MYHAYNNGLGGDSGRLPRTPSHFASGRTSGGASPYGGSAQQSGLYPSPYQNRHRLHSKHGSRGYKRQANTSAGGDGGISTAFGGSGTGVGLALSSACSHRRGRNDQRDRFLMDINNGGQRSGAATNTLFHARKETGGDSSGVSGGNTWLLSSAHRSTRLSGGGRTAMAPPQRAGVHASGYGAGGGGASTGLVEGRARDSASTGGAGVGGGGVGVGEGFGGGGRMSIPQRYTRSHERVDGGGGAAASGCGGGGAGIARRRGRHRGGHGNGVGGADAALGGKLPSIGGGIGGGGRGGGPAAGQEGGGGRAAYPKAQYGGGNKELVVRVEGCETSGVCTIEGHKPGNPRWENQDNYVMKEELGGAGVRLFVVLDGHGQLGHLVSRRCSDLFPKIVVDSGWSVSRSMMRMSDDLRTCAVDCSSSGATCVLTTIRGGKISVANLGDSKCVLGRLVNGQLCAVPLSEDHKPDRPDERQRILDIGGQVGSRHLVVGSSPSGPIRIPMGPARVWYRCRGDVMGLAMSRSLGDDIAHQAGVSSEPEVMEHEIDGNDQFLIMATDGVWDVTEIGQAVQIVQGYAARCRGSSWDPQGAASLLAHTARKRWEGVSAVVDDITAMVVRLNNNPP